MKKSFSDKNGHPITIGCNVNFESLGTTLSGMVSAFRGDKVKVQCNSYQFSKLAQELEVVESFVRYADHSSSWDADGRHIEND